ncbi:hypothetical protein VTO42DRAFT_1320 [Malbranchea cinnamomea]
MPRLIRRKPFLERLKSYLNPLDFLLWLSEELDTKDWEQWEKDWALPLGITLNTAFLIARANHRKGNRVYDDVFGDSGSTGWLGWLATFAVHFLTLLSVVNALYTLLRKREYRLFEAPIDTVPSTPSAHRVQVSSSPSTSTPRRLLSSIIPGSAEDRSHYRPERDVWQLSVWNPHPLAMKLFCLFSPGHVLVYWLFLPISQSDPRPSVTVVTTIVLSILLTIQMSTLVSSFTQQSKDMSLVHKEVMHEYDTKFVHPRTQTLMRSVGTQFSGPAEEKYNTVETFAPSLMRHGFKISPNPNYLKHIDPERSSEQYMSPRPSVSTPVQAGGIRTPGYGVDSSPSFTPRSAIRQPQFRPVTSGGDGGSLGVYSHAQSPLRKTTSSNFENRVYYDGRDRITSPVKRLGSPLKRSSVPGEVSTEAAMHRWGHIVNTGKGR